MLMCSRCQKDKTVVAFSRHGRGHGISGVWRLRAQITKRFQKPNLHIYKGSKYCTKCLRAVKVPFVATVAPVANP
jgi:hypothetical protein